MGNTQEQNRGEHFGVPVRSNSYKAPTYYGIDYEEVRKIPEVKETPLRRWLRSVSDARADRFVQLCSSRASVPLGTWDPATNGMIIEQQQILTTQNLAALFSGHIG